MGINKQTYSRADFYHDVQAYIRFKTPTISLRDLVAGESSLLGDIGRAILPALSARNRRPLIAHLMHDLKLFGCVARANLRDQVGRIKEQLDANQLEGRLSAAPPRVYQQAAELLDDLALVLSRYRELQAELLAEHVAGDLRDTFRAVDEYLSLVVETYLTQLLEAFDEHPESTSTKPGADDSPPGDAGARVRTRCRDLIVTERQRRDQLRYATVSESSAANEHYIYRMGQLKKFLMSVLWLEIEKMQDRRRLSDLGAAIAAGAAMFFTIVATIWHSNWLLLNSWSFVFAATVTYIFKDRIKDWLKSFFSRQMTRWLADHSVKIRDPISNRDIGRCKEAFSYVGVDQVPPEVLARRHEGSPKTVESRSKRESIIKYEKDVSIDGNEFVTRLRQPHYDVNDIIRFEISRFLARTDDPVALTPIYDQARDKVEARELPKVYHINVVLRLWTPQAADKHAICRVRVILDKRGIRRLEEL